MSFDLVDAALETAGAVQSRVVVYLLLAGALFTDIGYRQVWARLCAGLPGSVVACTGSSALSQALRRGGAEPLRVLFDLVRGPAAGAARWRGLLVCAIDGTSVFVPDSAANVAEFGRHGGGHAQAAYPMLRLLTVVACGTRTVVDVVFGSLRVAETAYAPRLFGCLRPGRLLLADRNFAVTALIEQITCTGADLLIRAKLNRRVPAITRLGDRSWLTRAGAVTVRVIDAEIAISCAGGPRRVERYRLITTLIDDKRYPAKELVDLYHQRWEIETSYFELKSTILGGRVLRARTPAGVAQEVYALLITYQALRTAIADTALATGDFPPGPGQFHHRRAHRPRPTDPRRRNHRRHDDRPDRHNRPRGPVPPVASTPFTHQPRVVSAPSPNTAPRARSTATSTKPRSACISCPVDNRAGTQTARPWY